MSSQTAPVAGYGLQPPREADVLAALHRVFGPERGDARWAEACRAAGLMVGRVGTGAPVLRAARALADQGGAAVAVARSIEIRYRTYERLAARVAPSPGAGA